MIDKKTLRRIFIGITGCILFAWLLVDTARVRMAWNTVADLFSPFVAGAAIAFIFNVPMRAIERQLQDVRSAGLRRGLSIVLTILALVLVIIFAVELLVPQIRLTVESLSQRIPLFVERTAARLMLLMEENPEIRSWILESLHMETIDWAAILKQGFAVMAESVSSVMGSAVSVIGNLTGAIVNTVISTVFALYCLSSKETLSRQGKKLLYSVLKENRADETVRIFRLTNVTFSNFISGQCLEAVILGCLFALVMALLKLPYIPLVSVIISLTALIPVVGAFVGCVVGAFFILVNDPIQAATFVVMFLILQQLENNLIYPRVVGTSIGLPGMWVLVAVTVGGEIMGVAGMLVMIPLASVVYALAGEFIQRRLAEKNIPPEKLEPLPEALPEHKLKKGSCLRFLRQKPEKSSGEKEKK